MSSEHLMAAALVAAYLLLCWHCLGKPARAASSMSGVADTDGDCVLVAYASQGGQAQQLAQRYVDTLKSSRPVRVVSLNQVDASLIRNTSLALFIVSTYGEGEPPDNALRFARQWVQGNHGERWPHLRFAILALGDSQYRQFCAFGRALASSLQQRGARALFDMVKVDSMNPGQLADWQHRLHLHGLIASSSPAIPVDETPSFTAWRLQRRTHLNPGSPGGAVWHLRLLPPVNTPTIWQAGDIAQILPGNDRTLPLREYSIASIVEDGAVELVVRQAFTPDGSLGAGSGWLTRLAQPGDDVLLNIRSNPAFHPCPADKPLILIGNGTGIAGLRAHLRAREVAGAHRNCLIFGERTSAHDFLFRNELFAWQHSRHLPELHLAFSRDPAEQRYVQQVLLEQAALLTAWIEAGAYLYICGSLQGMASGVQQALQTILGEARVEEMRIAGELRRDVY